MPAGAQDQPSRLKLLPRYTLDSDLQEFAIDRRARNLSRKTLLWYSQSLATFRDFCVPDGIHETAEISPSTLRRFILTLVEKHHNPGGIKNIYSAVKAFIAWYAGESAPAGWVNPLPKVKMPKVPEEPLEPVNLDDLVAMLNTCERRSFYGNRDRAMLMFLLDSGVRHQELTDLSMGDVDLHTGAVLVRSGKGRKPRTTFIGAKTRKALVAYFRQRDRLVIEPRAPDGAPLWLSEMGTRLTYSGIRQVIRRRAKRAGVPEPSLHSFRRAFALACLRNGVDVYSLQRMMGHADLSVLRRYLAQTEGDLQAAHERGGPVDRLLK